MYMWCKLRIRDADARAPCKPHQFRRHLCLHQCLWASKISWILTNLKYPQPNLRVISLASTCLQNYRVGESQINSSPLATHQERTKRTYQLHLTFQTTTRAMKKLTAISLSGPLHRDLCGSLCRLKSRSLLPPTQSPLYSRLTQLLLPTNQFLQAKKRVLQVEHRRQQHLLWTKRSGNAWKTPCEPRYMFRNSCLKQQAHLSHPQACTLRQVLAMQSTQKS